MGIDDDAGVAGRRSLQVMVMKMLHRCVTVAVVRLITRVTLLIAFVMLKRRGVVALVVVETAVRIHDDARLV